MSEYDDQRASLFATNTDGQTIDSFVSVDLTYNVNLEDTYGVNGFLSVQNAFDEDPPFARLDLNYDPYTHPSYGRVIKLGASSAFGGGS